MIAKSPFVFKWMMPILSRLGAIATIQRIGLGQYALQNSTSNGSPHFMLYSFAGSQSNFIMLLSILLGSAVLVYFFSATVFKIIQIPLMFLLFVSFGTAEFLGSLSVVILYTHFRFILPHFRAMVYFFHTITASGLKFTGAFWIKRLIITISRFAFLASWAFPQSAIFTNLWHKLSQLKWKAPSVRELLMSKQQAHLRLTGLI